ncbi:MAG TPA: YfhO family protein [Thermoanaerobaculia bacterium]|nr:YfhO family protein [Thermoanaerobaculia bacterium]
MVAILLYLVTSIALTALWRRYVRPMTNAAALVLVLLPFCFCGRALLTGRVYAPIDMPFMSEPLIDYKPDVGIKDAHNGWLSDLYMQMIPWQSAVRQSLAHGQWPLWNRHMLAGSILAANMQAAPYDPLQLLGFLIPHPQALTFGAAMTFFIAALFTFSFARSLGLGEIASFIAAAAYMFNSLSAFFVGWPIGRAWTYLPLVFLGVRMVVRETNLRAAIVLTSAFVLLIFAGHPETVLHVVVLGMVWGIYEWLQLRSGRAIALACLCGILALLLTAISLLPFSAAAPHTVEYHVRHDLYALTPFTIAPNLITQRIGGSLFPFYGGQPWRGNSTDIWEPTSLRNGSIVLALALAALVLAPRRRDTWFFFVLAFFCIGAGLNVYPFAQILHSLPLFNITLNERLGFAACFSLAMLAGIAMDAWGASRTRVAALVIALLGISLGIGASMLRDGQIKIGVDPDVFSLAVLCELIPLAILAVMLALRVPARTALPVTFGLLLLQRTIEDGSIYPAHPESMFYPRIPILKHMQDDPDKPFRMVGLHFAFLPDAAALYGLEDARGYEAMTFRRLFETYPWWCKPQGASFNNVFDKTRPFLSMLNVKYAIGSLDAQPDDQWKLVVEDRHSRLLENTRVLPRAFIPHRVRYAKDAQGILTGIASTTDFAEVGFITAPNYPPHEIYNGPGTLKIHRTGADYDIDAQMDLDGWVFLTESAWPGWRAYIDGKRVDTQYANHAFLGVFVPKGHHRLKMVFRPEAFTRGRNITFATIAGLIVFFALRRYRLQKPRAVAV